MVQEIPQSRKDGNTVEENWVLKIIWLPLPVWFLLLVVWMYFDRAAGDRSFNNFKNLIDILLIPLISWLGLFVVAHTLKQAMIQISEMRIATDRASLIDRKQTTIAFWEYWKNPDFVKERAHVLHRIQRLPVERIVGHWKHSNEDDMRDHESVVSLIESTHQILYLMEENVLDRTLGKLLFRQDLNEIIDALDTVTMTLPVGFMERQLSPSTDTSYGDSDEERRKCLIERARALLKD